MERKSTFSKNLIKVRKNKGFTQIELSNLTGFSRRMIAYYETSVINPPIDKIEIIAKALNVNITDLIETKKSTEVEKELSQINTKTLNKIKQILSLPPEKRHLVYSYVDSLLEKDKKKSKQSADTKNN